MPIVNFREGEGGMKLRERFGDILFLIGGRLLVWSAKLNGHHSMATQLNNTISEAWTGRKSVRWRG